MRPRSLYFSLCVLGTALPYSQFLPFLREHGLALGVFLDQLSATQISRFFALDVLVSAVVLWVFVGVEGKRRKMRHLWLPVAASLVVGVSLGLPLFLYLRESRLEETPA